MKSYAFIDASNLFYGGEKSLGWKIDYRKLLQYMKDKYGVLKVFYFGGVETHDFAYDYLANTTVPIDQLEKYLKRLIDASGKTFNEAQLLLLDRHLQRIRFYKKLEQFGYSLILKPVKLYEQEDGTTRRKANCDVEMAFYVMKEQNNFDQILVLSGDGDFLPLLKHLREERKKVIVLARGLRTAREIRQFAGQDFRDLVSLQNLIQMEGQQKRGL